MLNDLIEKQMMCCIVLLILPILCLKDDEKEPVRKRADWMELVAQRRYVAYVYVAYRSPTASSKLPNNKHNFETKNNLQSLLLTMSMSGSED